MMLEWTANRPLRGSAIASITGRVEHTFWNDAACAVLYISSPQVAAYFSGSCSTRKYGAGRDGIEASTSGLKDASRPLHYPKLHAGPRVSH